MGLKYRILLDKKTVGVVHSFKKGVKPMNKNLIIGLVLFLVLTININWLGDYYIRS